MELLGRCRKIATCFIALVCAIYGYSKTCYVVKDNYLNPARFSRTLEGVVSRMRCTTTCLDHGQCQGVYHDRLNGTCSHYDIDKVLYDRVSDSKTHPNGAIAMIHCDSSVLRVVPKYNLKFVPIDQFENVRKGCLDIGGTRLANESELVVLLSKGFEYEKCGWIYGEERRHLLEPHLSDGRKIHVCHYPTEMGYCKL